MNNNNPGQLTGVLSCAQNKEIMNYYVLLFRLINEIVKIYDFLSERWTKTLGIFYYFTQSHEW